MARAFTAKEVKALIQRHERLSTLLAKNSMYADRQRSAIRKCTENLQKSHAFAMLVDDEIEPKRQQAERSEDVFALQIPKDIFLLIEYLYKYIHSKALSEKSISLGENHSQTIKRELLQLEPATNRMWGLFTSSKKKADVRLAYAHLCEEIHGDYAQTIESVAADLERLDDAEQLSILQDFNAAKKRYRNGLLEIVPDAFREEVPSEKILGAINSYNLLLQRLDALGGKDEQIEEETKESVNQLMSNEILKILKEIPVEELGRGRSGIRQGNLYNSGYRTLADIFCATECNLVSAYGISNEIAIAIKQRVQQYAEQLRKRVKVWLSADNRNFLAFQMVTQIYKFRQRKLLYESLNQLKYEHAGRITRALSVLPNAVNCIEWLFMEDSYKQDVVGNYQYLSNMLKGEYAHKIEWMTELIFFPDKIDTSEAWDDFEKNSIDYFKTLEILAPGILGTSGTFESPEDIIREIHKQLLFSKEILNVVANHNLLLQRLDALDGRDEQVKEKITKAAERLLADEVLKILKEVPVEEMGREKSGIRYKVLRDFGYSTLADVFCATEYNLASVYGISDNAAIAIKHRVQLYAERVRKEAKIRISADDRNIAASELVAQIYRFRQQKLLCESLNQLKNENIAQITSAMSALQNVVNCIEWLFMEESYKQDIVGNYQYLDSMLKGEYAHKIEWMTGLVFSPDKIDASEAWDDFKKNSIDYFNVLELLIPGILGAGDTQFGLPEDLAREIQEQCFFPDGLKCTLRRYQTWGVKYILHQERVLLGDEMGLGKTVQAIATMVSLRNTGATHFLVVCPASVLPNWCREIAEKSKLRATKIYGQGREDAFKGWQKYGGVAVTNFETIKHLKVMHNFQFDMMIVDEAHYIKNASAQRTKNVVQMGKHTGRILYMTGTALENKVEEMIALVSALQPKVAKQLQEVAFMSSASQFREKAAPVYYRRKREDVLTELPDLIESKEWCMMSPQEEARYEETLLTKHYMQVRRLSWDVDNLENSCKARRLKEIVEEATGEDRKILVFSYFLATISQIYLYLGSRCLPPINGSVSPQRRQEIIEQFDEAPAGAVLLAQIQSGGTGLNIQAASVIIICEPQLKPSIENQAISRAYRMGQARNVMVYRLLCENSIDERIVNMLEEKQAVFDAFADQSVSAEATARKDVEIDEKTLGKIVKEEIDRINAEREKISMAEK